MRFRVIGALTLAGCLSAVLPALAQTAPPPPPARMAAASQVPDDTLKDRIAFRLETSSVVRKYDLRVKVDHGVARLSGDVATAAQKSEAERLAKVDGVTRVESEIKVDPDEDKSVADRMKNGMTKTGEAITDAWITTKVKWFYIGEDALKGSDINVDTANHTVTLKGSVKTAAGKARAVELARNTDGVTKVVDQLVIK